MSIHGATTTSADDRMRLSRAIGLEGAVADRIRATSAQATRETSSRAD
jgi:hypothetical protein